MIRLVSPSGELPRGLLKKRGGFLWWYVDAVDASGDGIVVIWSWGLPFLPGYTSAARAGLAPQAEERPSINVVIYRGGREVFYLFQEFEPSEAQWSGGVWSFGRSEIRSTTDGAERCTEFSLDLDVPAGGCFRGRLVLSGAPRQAEGEGLACDKEHSWSPLLGPATLRGEVAWGPHASQQQTFDTLAYHDRNGSPEGIDQLGIDWWTWGRFVDEERTRIYYYLVPRQAGASPITLGVEVNRRGDTTRIEGLELRSQGRRRDRWGVNSFRGLEFWDTQRDCAWLRVRQTRNLDRGPFYLRELVEDEEGRVGVAEYVVPGRVDLARHRALVQMRVHHTEGRNSMWLPLFAGGVRSPWLRLRQALGHRSAS